MSSFWEENHLSTVLARVALQDLRYFRGQHLPLALKYFELQHNLGPISTSETNTPAPGLCHPASESGPSLWPGEMMLTVKYFLLRKVTWTLSPTAPNVISEVKKTLSAENLRRRSVRQCQVTWYLTFPPLWRAPGPSWEEWSRTFCKFPQNLLWARRAPPSII